MPDRRLAGILRGNNSKDRMSALGQKQTSVYVRVMSALPPKADMDQYGRDVRFVPKADILTGVPSTSQTS